MSLLHLDRTASVFVARPLLAARVLRAKPGIPILMYHSVSDDPETGVSPYYRLATSPTRFREQMRFLQEGGYQTVDVTEAVRRIKDNTIDDRPLVAITFDDGFRDFATDAWPILQEFGFSATMFLPTSFIGRSRKTFKGRDCLTWSEVRTLRDAGASFGSHTSTHPKLHGLTWTGISRELADSRATIGDELQERIHSFSFPYAFPQEDEAFVTRFKATLVDKGYLDGVTTIIGRAGLGSDPLCLERLPVNQADDRELFSTKLAGAYDWLGTVQLALRRARRRRKGVSQA
jgi:peptidoglycan/xylan/chitin deacetylase (PgdA/CDA1 family)